MAKDDARPQAEAALPGPRAERQGEAGKATGKGGAGGIPPQNGGRVDLTKPARAAAPAAKPAPVSLVKPAGPVTPAQPVSLVKPAAPAAVAPRRRSRRFAVLKLTAALLVVSVGALTLPAGWFSAYAWNAVALVAGSKPPTEKPGRSSVLLADDGSPLATFYRENRHEVPLDKVAPIMRKAMLAAEDARFYDHGPVDTKGVIRAVVSNSRGGARQGASTLTQQYVKNLAIAEANGDPGKLAEATAPTMGRKIREFRQALDVERRYTKDEILEKYLNVTYFGAGAYGVDAAAQRYFSVPASDLTLPQAAMIAGLAKSPAADAPTVDADKARERRNLVLTRMVSAGAVSREDADAAAAGPLALNLKLPRYGCQDSRFPFFCDYVVSELRNSPAMGRNPEERIDRLLDGGLTIRTTLDPKTQLAAQHAVALHIAKNHKIGAAIAMVEPGTGAVRAIALNRSWGDGDGETQLNYATDKNQGGSAGFQGGSTFKPFVLAAAMKKGISPHLEFDAPSEITVDGFKKCNPDPHEDPEFKPYTVGNYEDESFGRINMREATAHSVNTYFLQLEKKTGVCKPPRIAERMGLHRADGRPLDRYPSFVLGAQEVSPLRMAEAYATLAAGGMHCPAFGIFDMRTADGRPVALPAPACERVLPEDVAHRVTRLLKNVIGGHIEGRTGAKMAIGRPAAGKTGTTNGARAVWFVGYTPELSAAVWAGYPARSRPLRDVDIKGKHYDTLYGGALPGPIWRDAMKAALEGRADRPLY